MPPEEGEGLESIEADSLQQANRQRLRIIVFKTLGVVEVVVQPLIGVGILTVLEIYVSPLPYLSLQPFSFNFAGNGVLITTFLKGIIMLGLLNDLYQLYRSDRSISRIKLNSDG